MQDTFAITILFLIISTGITAFIKGRSKDKCLKGFYKNSVVLEMRDGKKIQGMLHIEATGLELKHFKTQGQGHGRSYIMYKNEYSNIGIIIRAIDLLTVEEKKKREKTLKKIYNPSCFRKMKRKIRNLFATVRDSISEALHLFVGRLGATSMGSHIAGQQKYTAKMQKEFTDTLNTSFEPLIEKNIGHRVIVTINRNEKLEKMLGILKEYTSQFITLMDVEYPNNTKKSDIIIPRTLGIVRHFVK
ncbi:hypothetical protein ACFL4O_01820 [bacterium]